MRSESQCALPRPLAAASPIVVIDRTDRGVTQKLAVVLAASHARAQAIFGHGHEDVGAVAAIERRQIADHDRYRHAIRRAGWTSIFTTPCSVFNARSIALRAAEASLPTNSARPSTTICGV